MGDSFIVLDVHSPSNDCFNKFLTKVNRTRNSLKMSSPATSNIATLQVSLDS